MIWRDFVYENKMGRAGHFRWSNDRSKILWVVMSLLARVAVFGREHKMMDATGGTSREKTQELARRVGRDDDKWQSDKTQFTDCADCGLIQSFVVFFN